ARAAAQADQALTGVGAREDRVVEIGYLADHLALAPLLAEWHHREWADLEPGWTRAEVEAELRSHTGRRQVPTTFVAPAAGRPLGWARLRESARAGGEHPPPRAPSVFVLPEHRGRSLGRRLVDRAVEEAAALGLPVVYLFTTGREAYYEKLGWEPWQTAEHHGRTVALMRRRTGA